MTSESWAPVYFYETGRSAPIVLICEHASFSLPAEFGALGLTPEAMVSHAAGDIGALRVAKGLSDALDAPLVYGGVSRLLCDCNRPHGTEDAVPARSEIYEVPGNAGLGAAQRRARCDLIHHPFHQATAGLVEAQQEKASKPIAVVTVHSFTPVYKGQRRRTEIGFLHDDTATLSELSLQIEQRHRIYKADMNQPYDASDGVTYSLRRHAEERQLNSTMIEIRNDLIATDERADRMSAHLARTLQEAVDKMHAQGDAAR
ncbi:MAG: N-formylglutamate amidohydrolase [Geminicoccaceae bacterium]